MNKKELAFGKMLSEISCGIIEYLQKNKSLDITEIKNDNFNQEVVDLKNDEEFTNADSSKVNIIDNSKSNNLLYWILGITAGIMILRR